MGFIKIWIRASKENVFRKSVAITIGRTGLTVDAAQDIYNMISARADHPSLIADEFLFCNQFGVPLSRVSLLEVTSALLEDAGLDSSTFSGISFRRGGATSLLQRGIGDASIKVLGRWLSSSYESYLAHSDLEIAHVSRQMVSAPVRDST